MKHTTKNILTCNKPTGTSIKLFLSLIFLLWTRSVVAVIPVPNMPIIEGRRNELLPKVVDDWIAGGTRRTNVESKYGPIEDWDTSAVTRSMYRLFYLQGTFNADLSKWNVAKVTDMYWSTCQLSRFNSLFTACFLFLPLSLLEVSFIF